MTATKQAKLAERLTTFDDLPKVLLPNIAQSVVDRRALRLASKNFSQTLEHLECVDAEELKNMRKEPEPCRNTAKVFFNPEKGIQRAIICAIMSPDNKLHVYVNRHDLVKPEVSESVKCFDQRYALELTLLYPATEDEPPQPGELRCIGGFRALKGGLASDGRLQNQEGVEVVRFTGNTSVPPHAFSGYKSLMELLDVNTLTTIGDFAFLGTSLTELGDLSALETIGFAAFHDTLLTQLVDMPSLTTIENRAFQDTRLAKLGDLSALKTIGLAAFQGTQLTQLVNMPELTTIGNRAFQDTRLAKLGDLSALETIGDFAFKGTQLTQLVDMPELTTIGNSAFEGCEHLEIVHLPKALKYVEKYAFLKCPLGQLTVEPGAIFECRCDTLSKMLRKLKGVTLSTLVKVAHS